MKKILSLFAILFAMFTLSAQEQVLFDAAVKADLDGYDYVSNFEMRSDSGYFTKDSFKILEPNDKGLRFMAIVPEDKYTNYEVVVAYPSFLNESGSGAGVIYNAASIKQIKVEASTNRPNDEIVLLYSTSPTGPVHEIKMPQDSNKIKSLEGYELVYDNPLYIDDPAKREVKAKPVLGADADGIYLRGFKIKANPASGFNAPSQYSIFYLKKVSVVCDKAFTDEQLEEAKVVKEAFGIDENKSAIEKVKSMIIERNRVRETEKSLMATESTPDAK